jgi:DNA-binding MarR family transcriptional regulator
MDYNIVDTIMLLNEQCCHFNSLSGEANKLTMKELQVILSLHSGESVSSADLAKRNMLSPSRMSRIIDRLASRGLLSRQTDEHDRRYSRVSLTHEGENAGKTALEYKKECELKIKSRLSDREFAIIQKAFHLLLFAMENEYGNDINDTAEHH